MCATFTDDDVGKTVVNANGEEVGIVSGIEHGTAHIEPDPGVTDTIRAKLGWEDTNEDTYPLQEQAVARVTDDEIRLESDLSGVGGTSTGAGTGTGTGSGTDTGAGTGTDRGTDTDLGDDSDSGLGRDSDSDTTL